MKNIILYSILALLLSPAMVNAITIEELRELIPRGDDFAETTCFRMGYEQTTGNYLERDYIGFPDGMIAVVYSPDTDVAVYSRFSDKFSVDTFRHEYPKRVIFISGDRFFGLVNTNVWDENTLLTEDEGYYYVHHAYAENRVKEYCFDKVTGFVVKIEYLIDNDCWQSIKFQRY